MTDDRFRSQRGHAQAQSHAPGGGAPRTPRRFEDPLAELARLIGQEDPFADFVAHSRTVDARSGNGSPPRTRPYESRSYDRRVHETRHSESRSFESRSIERGADRRLRSSPASMPVARMPEIDPEPAPRPQPPDPRRGNGGGAQATYTYGGNRAFEVQAAQAEEQLSALARELREEPAYAPHGTEDETATYAPDDTFEERGAPPQDEFFGDLQDEPDAPHADGHDEHERVETRPRPRPEDFAEPRAPRRAPAAAPQEPAYERFDGADYDPEYVDDAYLPAHADEFYEEAPHHRTRTWLIVAAVATAVVIVAGSGVLAYRALFGSVQTVAAAPKTIRPDTAPSKIVPPAPAKTADSGNKQIYDRVGGEERVPQGERLVPREEAPIEAARGASRAATPAGPTTALPLQSATTAPPPMAAPAMQAAGGEPRRVRTVTVRSDGTIVSDPNARAATTRAAPGAVSNGPMTINSFAGQPNQPAPQQQAAAAAQPSPPPQARALPQQPAPAGDNPWADLRSGNQPQAAAPAPTTQAALPPQTNNPPPAPSPPPPTVAVQSTAPAGSYVVQVASQKSEVDAQNSWRQLQQRYSAVLGGQQASIRRVDLGERGVFYRAQLGPYNSRAQASEICQSLKAAGGECVIQRN